MKPTPPLSPVDPRTGLIRWVLDLPVEPGEPKIFNASVKMADVSRYNRQSCYDNNGGSGLTRAQARNAAIGEGLERYCAAVFQPEDLICGSVGDLRESHALCEPSRFALFHPEQPGRFPLPEADAPIAWAWAWSLARKRATLVPACLVYMPYFPCFRDQGEKVVGPAISTGLACAETLDEALLRGIYESVERDAFMITWMNRLPAPRIEFRSNPALLHLYEERLQREGLRYMLLRTTTDIAIPSFLCLLIDDNSTPPMVCAGGASNLDPTRAAAKAMTESVQTREWVKYLGRGGRKFEFANDFSDIREFEDHVALYGYGDMLHAVGFLLESAIEQSANAWESAATGCPRKDLERALTILAEHRMDALALDLTTADVAQCGLKVTRVMIPELQPLDAHYQHRFMGGRRLYDVPQRLGYSAQPTTIESLNPYPHPYP